MGAFAGPERNVSLQTTSGRSLYSLGVVQDGLVLNLDASKFYSYPKSGTTWTDLTNNGNTGTLVNGVGYNSANRGSLVFDGVNDYVNCQNAANLQITVGTISAWFNANSGNNAYNGIITKQEAWSLFVKDNVLVSYDWGNTAERNTGITVGNSTWNYAAMTFTQTVGTPSNNAIIYLNGTSVLTTTVKHVSQATPVVVGDGGVGASQNFGGNMAQALIYNRALTATEITQNFNATRARFGI
jgi:hypothetical protein